MRVLIDCSEDAERLGCVPAQSNEEIACIEEHLSQCSSNCRLAMHQLSQCLLSPRIFLPMEIASVTLLVTASFVLFCTLVRCCCRHFCLVAVSHPPPEINLDDTTELSDASDDESHAPRSGSATAGTTSSTTSGNTPAARREEAARAAATKELDDDQELPSYQQLTH